MVLSTANSLSPRMDIFLDRHRLLGFPTSVGARGIRWHAVLAYAENQFHLALGDI